LPSPTLPRIAIATGDPAGIGPEVSLKAALDAGVRQICRPLLVGDPAAIEMHAKACGIAAQLHVVREVAEASWGDTAVNVLAARADEPGSGDNVALRFGVIDPAYGRASLAAARRAIQAALAREVDAVVAAPQTEKAIALAGIKFDGYPTFVARETGIDERDVYLMLCFDDYRVVNMTLHCSVRDALAMVTRERVAHVIRATADGLRRMGIAAPRIFVGGLNPHAGEDGLFGREEIEIIAPAIADARESGIDVAGPFGADTMFHKRDCDAHIVMLHDQGHIPAKLLGFERTAALPIGSPILFASVAHGSAHDIAGKGVANPGAMISAIARMAKAVAARGSR
jgi:4-hydroxythreonine-4-phosphate dehydrogenase